ncbi:MAG: hypothetical protein R3C26_14670 [Calditrichia bacterium]
MINGVPQSPEDRVYAGWISRILWEMWKIFRCSAAGGCLQGRRQSVDQ